MIRLIGLIALAMLSASPAPAQDWPNRTIRIIVGAGVGGGTDIITRIIGQPLSDLLGQAVVVENKQGAGNIVAASALVNAPKDGYTAYMINNSHGVSAALYKSLPFDSLDDFEFVSFTGTAGLVLVTAPDFPANDVKGVIAAAKAAPGKYNFASVGTGTTQHFSGELFRQLTGIDIKHIPYRGTPPAITGLLAGEVHMTFELVQPVLGQIRAGQLKAIAVTSPQRYPVLPDVPTVAESGVPEFQVMSWYGLVFPAGTPRPIVDKMNKALHEVLAREDVRKQIVSAGATPQTSTPEELREHVAKEIAKWSAVREKAGIPQQ